VANGIVSRYGKGPDSDATDTLIASTLKGQRGKGGGVVAYALRKDPGGTGRTGRGTPMAVNGASVRRLTPTECERLQALPDGWTRVPDSAPDSRRYAGLGDAVTASVGEWIGRRIIDADRELA
jgi:DNA (cytosine-5)-methyltransferase 1